MTRRLAAPLAALLLAAPVHAQDGLAGSEWAPVTLSGAPAPEGVEAFIRFGADGVAAGSSGCNRFTGGYEQDGETLTFGPLAATRMACAGPAGVMETAFFQMIEAVRGARREGPELTLLNEAGETVATLRQRDRD